MSMKYKKKKIVLEFDKKKPVEKYVAANVIVGSIGYKKLCDEVHQRTGIHRGIVDVILKGLQDSMITFLEESFSIKLGEFGSFRPAMNAESQNSAEDVDASTIIRKKIVFTPGPLFKDMLESASVEIISDREAGASKKDKGNPKDDTPSGPSNGEAPDPAA